jgi:hypothetical protein
MGQAYVPAQSFTSVSIGTTSISNPTLLLKVDGVVYPNGYRVTYGGGFRNFYPSIDAYGNVYISCHTIAYGEDLPQYNLSNVEICLIK